VIVALQHRMFRQKSPRRLAGIERRVSELTLRGPVCWCRAGWSIRAVNARRHPASARSAGSGGAKGDPFSPVVAKAADGF